MISSDSIKVPDGVKQRVGAAAQAFRDYRYELRGTLQEMLLRQQAQLEQGKRRAEAVINRVEFKGVLDRGNAVYARVGSMTSAWQGAVQRRLGRVRTMVSERAPFMRRGNDTKQTPSSNNTPDSTDSASNPNATPVAAARVTSPVQQTPAPKKTKKKAKTARKPKTAATRAAKRSASKPRAAGAVKRSRAQATRTTRRSPSKAAAGRGAKKTGASRAK